MQSHPGITLTGLDENCSPADITQLLKHPVVELGLLYSATPEGRPRYPALSWLVHLARQASGRCAIHICGTPARSHLFDRKIDALVAHADRIQINGTLSVQDVEQACALYPEHTIITQYHAGNAALLEVTARNHALLVDGSGGRGCLPEGWSRPGTRKAVGFAGGLGPDTLADHLPKIAAAAGDSTWWVDMESRVRSEEDWFEPGLAQAALAAFDHWCGQWTVGAREATG